MAGESQSRCQRFRDWLKSPAFLVYLSHTLSAWGDRMWTFAVGLFLVQLSEDLRLVAIYGFSRGGTILLFAPVVGDWIDRNMRLRAVRTSLFIQNTFVILSAVLLCIMFYFKAYIMATWEGGLFTLFAVLVIIMTNTASLASVATKICIEKDWVVVICMGSKGKLANLNATVRRIDLTTAILAPVAVGQIMTYFETPALSAHIVTAIFIVCWNILSVFLEYGLLYCVYRKVPDLAIKRVKEEKDVGENSKSAPAHEKPVETTKPHPGLDSNPEQEEDKKSEYEDTTEKLIPGIDKTGDHVKDKKAGEDDFKYEGEKSEEIATQEKMLPEAENSKNHEEFPTATDEEKEEYTSPYTPTTAKDKDLDKSCIQLMFSKLIVLFTGWGVYMSQAVMLPGLGLAFLYMTVLAFDNVTVGYAFSQGYTESILGVCMAAGSVIGILGTVGFTFLRKRIGLERTGLFGFGLEIMCLTLCVVSIWTPGSPFIGYQDTAPKYESMTCELKQPGNTTAQPPINVSGVFPVLQNSSSAHFGRPRRSFLPDLKHMQRHPYLTANFLDISIIYPIREEKLNSFQKHGGPIHSNNHGSGIYESEHVISRRDANNLSLILSPDGYVDNFTEERKAVPVNTSYSFLGATFENSTHICKNETRGSLISVTLLVVGIITGRFGLWMADLTVTQLLQENVKENERGVVNGVQSSLNMLLGMLKFLLVIIAPRPETFGILIILSFIFVCCGGTFYAVYSRKIRGHLFHFGKCLCCENERPQRPRNDHTGLAVINADTTDANAANSMVT